MGTAFLVIMLLGSSVTALGQVSTAKHDIPESAYLNVQEKAKSLLDESTYRLTRNLEYFEDRAKPPRIAEATIKEVVQPNKWRTGEEKDYRGKRTKEERLWDGEALYVRRDDGEWSRYSGGSTVGGRIESGRVTTIYRHLGAVEIDGKRAELYEIQSLRVANKFSATDLVVVRYVRNIREWYLQDGRLFKRIEENMIEGREELSRETTTIEYDPQGLKIEAPIK